MSDGVRLDKLVANLGYGSRKDVALLARAGRVALDGVPIASADRRIARVEAARLTIDDAPLDPLPGLVLAMHKPLDVTCSHKEAGPLVYSLLPERWRRRAPAISTVGRLDKDTSGLLLLTDDGDLLHRIISPKAKIAKRYRVDLAASLPANAAAIFASGTLMLEGETKPLEPAVLEVAAPTRAHVTITEGRYHQVRRMFAALGVHVTGLHRETVGGLRLPDELAAGDYKILAAAEIASIFATGGRREGGHA